MQMEHKQNNNHFQVMAKKKHLSYIGHRVCVIQKEPEYKGVNRRDRVLGDVLQKADWKLQKFLGHVVIILQYILDERETSKAFQQVIT